MALSTEPWKSCPHWQHTCCWLLTSYCYVQTHLWSLRWRQITDVTIVCLTDCSGAERKNQPRKHQCSASLAFVRRIHRWPLDSLTKGQLCENVSTWWRPHVIESYRNHCNVHYIAGVMHAVRTVCTLLYLVSDRFFLHPSPAREILIRPPRYQQTTLHNTA